MNDKNMNKDHLRWDGGYGWVNVAACVVLLANTWGLAIAYSVSLSWYATRQTNHEDGQEDTILGTSLLNVVAISGLQTSQALVMIPLGTWLLGVVGMRWLTWLGVLVQTVSLVGASFARDIWQFYLGQGIGFGWGIGLIMVATQHIVPQWFDQRGSLASGTAGLGVGLGGLIWSYLSEYLLDRLGFGLAIRILALITGFLMVITTAALRERGDLLNLRFGWLDVTESGLLCGRYGWLLLYSFIMTLADMAILTQITTYGATVLQLSSGQLATVTAMVVLGQIVGRPCIGYASDQLGRINVAIVVSFTAGTLTLAIWTNTYSFGLLIFYVICLGALAGVWWSLIGPITVDTMGLQAYPDAISTVFLSLVVPSAVSPLISLKLVESEQGYLGVQLYAGILFLVASVVCFFLRRSAQTHNQKLREQLTDAEDDQIAIQDDNSGKVKLRWGIQVI